MKRVVIIGADFSPSSLPPATRIRFFAKHLPQFGWEPVVLTTQSGYYESQIDMENERLVPDGLRVVRTPALPASLMRKIGIGDLGLRTIGNHWRALSKLQKENKIDLIFIPVPPSITMVLGRLANLRFGIPYVVDYIDPWVTDYYWTLPRKQRPPKWLLSYVLSRCLEPFALRRARHITGVSQGTTDQVVRRYSWLSRADATEIPYGAEAGDFEYLREHPRQNPVFDGEDGKIHICSVGAYVESMEQTLRAFFKAFLAAHKKSPELFDNVLLHFVGTTYATNGADPFRVTAIARDCGIEEWIREQPQRVSYLDSLQIMLDSQALILLGSSEPHYTASKVFPYILAERPLLTIFHEDSSVNTILDEVRPGRTVRFREKQNPCELADEISHHLEDMVGEMLRGDWIPNIRWEAFDPYTTKALTGRLAETFDKAVAE
ncbi:MAG TPA: glycosyltransferase [Pyrinomonadaceae bacterium]|nr:glycosyltransferase [Pyrinomonadaceae bacterium]